MLPNQEIDIRPAMKLITEETGVYHFDEVLQKMERYGGTMQRLENLKMSLENKLQDLVIGAYNLQRELTADIDQVAKRRVDELRYVEQQHAKESSNLSDHISSVKLLQVNYTQLAARICEKAGADVDIEVLKTIDNL